MKTLVSTALVAATVLTGPGRALAVPSFARQTGFECIVCHLSWPELTSVGRQFKLGGYTLMRETKGDRPLLPTSNDGPPPLLPLAAMVQGSLTHTRGTSGADASNFPRNDDFVLQQLSLFYAGRIVEHFGAFVQWTYDGVAHHSSVDNVDVRLAGHFEGSGVDLSHGVTVNNNPTVSDLYNTTPAWGFPYASSSVAVAPNASTLIDGGLSQQVAGIGAYTMLNRTFYGEIAGYRTADGAFSLFRAGTDKTTDAVLDGTAPYWRVALQHGWEEGTHAAMIGTYGIARRLLLKRGTDVVTLTIAAVLVGNSRPAAGKATKSEFGYREQGHGGKTCGQCKFFSSADPRQPLGSCSIVEGAISRDGWCTAFAPTSA